MSEQKRTAAKKPPLQFKDPLIQWRPLSAASKQINGYVGEAVLFYIRPNKPERIAMGDSPFVLSTALPGHPAGGLGFKTDTIDAAKAYALESYKDWYKSLRKATENS